MPIHRLTFFASIFQTALRDRRNSRKVIDSYRDQSLRVLLRRARENVPFQRSRLANIDLKNIRLEDIPPTDKTTMMASFNETIAGGVV